MENDIPRGDVEEQMERLLANDVLKRSQMLCDMLRFVVEETLEGRQHTIKGYTLATRVFGRPDDFDPSTDPIVRIHAGRLRRRLNEYYAGEGADDPVHIEIPKGGYVAVFSRRIGETRARRREEPAAAPSELPGSRFDRPSVAVLPFVAVGGSDEAELIAEGLSEELTMALVRYQGLAVIARQSTLRYKGSMPTIEEVGRDLGVRFVVTGSVRKAGETLQVAAHLTDVRDSSHLWADSYNRNLSVSNLFDIQNEIATKVVAAISDDYGVITRQLAQETRGKRPDELTVYEAALRFYQYNQMPDNESSRRARNALEAALKKDPDYALGWALLAELCVDGHNLGFDGPEDPVGYAHQCIHKALNLDPCCQQSQATAAYVHFVLGEYETAIETAKKAVELNPQSAFLVATSVFWMGLSGPLDRACEILAEVDPLVPNKPGWLRLVPVLHNLDMEDYERANAEALRFCTPQLAWDPMLRAATASLAGNNSAANMAHREFTELFPEVAEDPEPYIRGFVHADHHVEKLLEGLTMAAQFDED